MRVSECTAPATRRHRSVREEAKCPVCRPRSQSVTTSETAVISARRPPAPAESQQGSVEWFVAMADSDTEFDRIQVVEADSVPIDILVDLALRDENDYVREAAASHARLPADTVAALFEDDFYGVRMSAAMRDDVPPHLLVRCAEAETDDQVLAAIAANPRTPLSTVRAILRRDIPMVGEVMAAWDTLGPHLVEALSWSAHQSVRVNAVLHPAASFSLLCRMATSDNASEIEAASEAFLRSELPHLDIHPENRAARRYLIDNAEWWALSSDSPEVRFALSINRNP